MPGIPISSPQNTCCCSGDDTVLHIGHQATSARCYHYLAYLRRSLALHFMAGATSSLHRRHRLLLHYTRPCFQQPLKHLHAPTPIYRCMETGICTYTSTFACMCAHTGTHTCTCTWQCLWANVRVHLRMQMRKHRHRCASTAPSTDTCTCNYRNTQTQTHTPCTSAGTCTGTCTAHADTPV